jgi:hypothetical protein
MNNIRPECEKICKVYNIEINSNLNDENYYKEFAYRVNWIWISRYQNLSEGFIREFANRIDWYDISIFQKLNEGFINKFADKVDWGCISVYQKLSEGFIREFADKVDWYHISTYQKLSEEFIKEYNLKISPKNWLYKSKAYKKNYIRTTTDFIIDDGIIGYVDDVYIIESSCDCNASHLNSFGLYVCTTGKYKVKVHIDDLGVVLDRNTLRCFKFKVL